MPKMVRTFTERPLNVPEINAAMSDFNLDFNGYIFEVYRRRPAKAR